MRYRIQLPNGKGKIMEVPDGTPVHQVNAFAMQILQNYQAEPTLPPSPPSSIEPDRTVLGTLGDVGVSALKGAVQVPQAFVGIADIATGGWFGKKLADTVGYEPQRAIDYLDTLYSPAQQHAFQNVHETQGFFPTLKAGVQNPMVPVQNMIESFLPMLGGAGVAGGVLKLFPKVSPYIAGAVGEGFMQAGGSAEQRRAVAPDGLLTPRDSTAAVGSGVVDALIGGGFGKIAQKAGLTDVQTLLAGGGGGTRGRVVNALGGSVGEFGQESVQGSNEKMWENWRDRQPLTQGVGSSAAQGGMAGALMGGTAGFTHAGGSGKAAQKPFKEQVIDVLHALGVAAQRQGQLQGQQAPQQSAPFSAGHPPPPQGNQAASLADMLQVADEQNQLPSAADATAAVSPSDVLQDPERMTKLLAQLEKDGWVNAEQLKGQRAQLQNRNRETLASQKQVNSIASNPDYARLSPTRDLTTGAPVLLHEAQIPQAQLGKVDVAVDAQGRRVPVQYAVVDASQVVPSNTAIGSVIADYAQGRDGKLRVVSGNARTAGIIEAYRRGMAEGYRQELIADLAAVGVDAAGVEQLRAPMLVRLMQTKDLSDDIADRTNTSQVSQLEPVDQAKRDARYVVEVEYNEDGTPSKKSIIAFAQNLPEGVSGVTDATGEVSQQAEDRLMAAVFYAAYESPELVRLYAAARDAEAKGLLNALAKASADLVALKGTAFDFKSTISAAAGIIVRARRDNMRLDMAVQQQGFWGNEDAMEVAKFFADNIRRTRYISERLRHIATLAKQVVDMPSVDIFGEAAPTYTQRDFLQELGHEQRGYPQGTQNSAGQSPAQSDVFRETAGDGNQGGRASAAGLEAADGVGAPAPAPAEQQVNEPLPAVEPQVQQQDVASQATEGGNVAMFSRSREDVASGLQVARLQRYFEQHYPAGKIVVYADRQAATQALKDSGVEEVDMLRAEGFYNPRTQQVGLIASALTNEARALEVARHEVIGHFGIETIVNDALGAGAMDKLSQRVISIELDGNKAVNKYAEMLDRSQPGLSDAQRGREIVAMMAEHGEFQMSPVKQLFHALRLFLNKVGLGGDVADVHLSRLIELARKRVQQRETALSAENAQPTSDAQDGKATQYEYAQHRAFLDGSPVAELTGDEFKVDGVPLTQKVPKWYKENGYDAVTAPQIGSVWLDVRAVKDSLSHGMTRDKAAAFAAVPAVLMRGKVIHTEPMRGSSVGGMVHHIAAPIRIGARDFVMSVLVKFDTNRRRMYVHEVVLKEKLQQSAFKTEALTTEDSAQNGADAGAVMSVLKKIYAVNNESGEDTLLSRHNGTAPSAKDDKDYDLFRTRIDAAGQARMALGEQVYNKVANGINHYVLRPLRLNPDLPSDFADLWRKYMADVTRAGNTALDVAKEGMANLNATERRLISDFIEKGIQTGMSQDVVDTATMMQTHYALMGQELVRLKMLSEKQLIHDGRYITRVYRTPKLAALTSKGLFLDWFDKVRAKTIRGDQLKRRGIARSVPAYDVRKFEKMRWKIRGMQDGAQVPGALMRAIRNGTPAPRPYNNSTKVVMWRDYTEQERAKLGEVKDGILRFAFGYAEMAKDVAIGRLFKAIAENPELSQDRDPHLPGWEQVPGTTIIGTENENGQGAKKFGMLAGLWVPREVFETLRAHTKDYTPMWRAYDKAMSYWKAGKTVLNPVAHGNNFVSNVFMMFFAHGFEGLTPSIWRRTYQALKNKNDDWKAGREAGLLGNEFASQEVVEIFLPQLQQLVQGADLPKVLEERQNLVTRILMKGSAPAEAIYKKMQRLYELEDQFFKLASYLLSKDAGASDRDAVNYAEKFFFNYALVPSTVNWVKRLYSPFFTYTYKALPAIAYTAMTRPDRLLLPVMALGGVNWLAYAILGADADEDKERSGLPSYMEGRTAIGTLKSLRMPWNRDGMPVMLDLSRRVPLGDLLDLNNRFDSLPVPQPLMPSQPVFSAILAQLFNIDTFTGHAIVKRTDTAWESAKKNAGWMYRQFAPNFPALPGTYSFNKLMDGMATSFDSDMLGLYSGLSQGGVPVHLPEAIADVFTGTKLRSYDPQKFIDYKENDYIKQVKDIRAQIRSAMMQRNYAVRNNMPLKKHDERIEELRKKLARVHASPSVE